MSSHRICPHQHGLHGARIHVFSEQFVASSLAQLAALKAAHAASGVKFCANLSSRYKPWFRALEAALRAGEIGEVRGVQAQKSYRLGERPDFYRQRSSYGGTIPWIGSHPMDWIPWLTRERYESVYATHSRRHNFGYGELEVSAQCQFTLSNEICASVSIDFLHPKTVAAIMTIAFVSSAQKACWKFATSKPGC